jgi:hypothetical protein
MSLRATTVRTRFEWLPDGIWQVLETEGARWFLRWSSQKWARRRAPKRHFADAEPARWSFSIPEAAGFQDDGGIAHQASSWKPPSQTGEPPWMRN